MIPVVLGYGFALGFGTAWLFQAALVRAFRMLWAENMAE